jgi:Effector protein
MSGGATKATNGDQENFDNGKGTDMTVQIGAGFASYGESNNGTIGMEILSQQELLDHELVHAWAGMNGEGVPGDLESVKNTYPTTTGGGAYKTETMYPEEAAVMGLRPRESAKKISYPSENGLRYEQNLPKRLSYKRP